MAKHLLFLLTCLLCVLSGQVVVCDSWDLPLISTGGGGVGADSHASGPTWNFTTDDADHDKEYDDASQAYYGALGKLTNATVDNILELVLMQGNLIQALNNKIAAKYKDEDLQKVAFEAYFTEGGSFEISLDAPIAFSHVALNVGNAYDNFTGIFTAPIAGVYLFILSTKKDAHNGLHMVLGIYVNDRLERQTDVAYKTTTALLASLKVGDTVNVKHYQGDTELDKWWDTCFTGIFLFPLN